MENNSAKKLADLANLGLHGEITPQNSLRFMDWHGIGHKGFGPPGLAYPGFFFKTVAGEKEPPFVYLSTSDKEKAQNNLYSSIGTFAITDMEKLTGKIITEEDINKLNDINEEPWNTRLCNVLTAHSHEAQTLLIKFGGLKQDGNVYIPNQHQAIFADSIGQFVQDKLHDFLTRNPGCIKFDTDSPIPKLVFSPFLDNYATLEDELNAEFYIKPYMQYGDTVWKKARFCAECKNIFFYKHDDRARYCSSKCRMKAANNARRKK